ncbi:MULTISPECIES: condensation domain-containing protein [unclassified Streptomyces]|uniref:condensation domain-containing protein n=1 Tax=unclassified Streptomyces TaxID=2593676 RepID=UPI0036EBF270
MTATARRPLSDMQQSMLAHEAFEDRPLYNMPLHFRIDGALDADALASALAHVVARHPVLHCLYDGAEATPADPSGAALLRDTAGSADEAAAAVARTWQDPLDVRTSLPVRARLVSLSPDEHHFGLGVHHVAGDSWSLVLLLRELATAYNRLVGGRAPDTEPPAPDFFDHADGEQRVTWDTTWWSRQLRDVASRSHPRTDPPGEEDRCLVVSVPLALDAADTRGVRELARAARVSPASVLLTAVSLSTAPEAPGGENVIGLPAVLRDTQELQKVMGPLLNTLPVQVTWDARAAADDLVRAHHDAMQDALAHKEVPYSRILRGAGGRRRPGTAPLFLHVVNVDNELPRLRLRGARTTWVPVEPTWAIFPAHWEFSWGAVGDIHGVLRASADAFDPGQTRQCAAAFRSSLSRLLRP